MKKVFLLIILLFVVAGCSSKAPDTTGLTFTEAEFPRVDGSTATIPLGEAAAAVLMGIERGEGSRFADFSGTDRAFRNLRDGNVDILIVYEPAQETVQHLGGLRDFLMAPIGYDALVFIVNTSNPVENLTVEQVRGIYAGHITRWSEVGGEDAPIIPFQRNVTAGSHALMLALLMKDTPLIPSRQDYMQGGMGMMLSAVADFDGGRHAIGYNVYFYVEEMMRNPAVRILSIDGVAPSQETISSGAYPLTNPFYAVVRTDEPKNSPAYLMYHWLQGAEAQRLIYLEGYAPVERH